MDYTNKNVAVLGFGLEGESIVRFLLGKAQSIHVFYEAEGEDNKTEWEQKGIVFHIGPFADLSDYDIIFRSPGIRPDVPVLNQARELGKTITSSTNLFFELCPCPIIGVTGTKGKGTTSSLIVEMLKEERKKNRENRKQDSNNAVFLGGNIGIPPLDFLSDLTKDSLVVLELSSFQLMDCTHSPHIAVLLMTVPEHLNWHASKEEYIEAKSKIFTAQTSGDFAVINTDYPLNRSVISKIPAHVLSVSTIPHDHPGCYVSDAGHLIYQNYGNSHEILKVSEIKIPGSHNWENACAAVAVAKTLDVSTQTIRTVLKIFAGLPHRLELVGIADGVSYYNDSFSTTPETAIAAIRAFFQPKILILGGSSKQSDFTELGKVIGETESIRGIIGIGEEWEKIKLSIKPQVDRSKVVEGCKTMKEIIDSAKSIAQTGDVVLLSPACASFDMFKNYKDRGNQFREEVKMYVV